MIERTSPPAARARAASSRRPAGVMTNWSAARTSSAPMPDRAAGAAACEEPLAPLALGGGGLLGQERADRVPGFGRRHQRRARVRGQVHAPVPGAPQLADVGVAALGLGAVVDIVELAAVERERGAPAVDLEAQRRIAARRGQLEAILDGGDRVGLVDRPVDRSLERPDVKRRTQLDPDGAAVDEVIRDVHGVLLMEHVHALFDDGAAELVPPDGQAEVEPELGEVLRARPLEPAARALLAADLEARAVRQPEPLGEMVQHERCARAAWAARRRAARDSVASARPPPSPRRSRRGRW